MNGIVDMSEFKFFNELTETRIFKRLDYLKGQDANDICMFIIDTLLILNFLWHEDKQSAIKYAKEMMRDQSFTGFRTTQNDLYNAIVVLLHQEKYSDKIKTNYGITLPEMRLKRIIRNMSNGHFNEDDYHQLMLILFREIKGRLPEHERMRRLLHNYKTMKDGDKQTSLRFLLQRYRVGKRRYSDVYPMLDKVYRRYI